MPRLTDGFKAAQTVELFSHLEEKDVDYFRTNYPDFAPRNWWVYKLTLQDIPLTGAVWNLQLLLDDPFWKQEPFRPNNPSGGSTYAFRQQTTPRNLWQQNQDWLRQAWKASFEISILDIMKLLTSVFDPETSSVPRSVFASLLDMHVGGPYQRGITYLYEHKWRARFCAECKKRFVAAESKSKFCSETCSEERTARRHREWWSKNGKKWRARKN